MDKLVEDNKKDILPSIESIILDASNSVEAVSVSQENLRQRETGLPHLNLPSKNESQIKVAR